MSVFVHPGFPDKKAFLRAMASEITVKSCSMVIRSMKLWSQTDLFSLLLAGCLALGNYLAYLTLAFFVYKEETIK